MLPVYEAIDIVQVIPKNVGHTQPWVVIANTPQGAEPYVVKLYTPLQIQLKNSVTAEVISNVLASEFSLNAPKAAFIDIPESLLITKPMEWQEQFDNADARLKFATFQIQSVNQAATGLDKKFYDNKIELDTLYAFDNLIKNGDRGLVKTNLLVGKDAWLIDHEMALAENDIDINSLDGSEIDQKFTKYHLFHTYLKNSWANKKQFYFDEFTEYLRTLNINQLDAYFNQLNNYGYSTNEQQIINWLQQVKQNSTNFVNSLKVSIQ